MLQLLHSESTFLTNCNDCSFCWNCEGLDNKKHCIDNVQYEKEEYNLKIQDLKSSAWGTIIEERKSKKQNETILFSTGSSGHHIRNSKNAINCVDSGNLEDCKNCTWFFDSRDCQDIYSWGQNSEMCYDDVAIGENNYGVLFCANINTNCRNMLYCMHCRSSSNCFGCIGLHDAEYCIFNKQYTSKEKYEEEVERIIRHMIATKERGEFFHPSLSPFGYNETVAQEYYPEKASGSQPLAPSTEMEMGTKPVAGTRKLEAFGYKRSTYEAPKPVSDKVILGKDLPNTIEQVDDSILQSAIQCEVTGKLFRIQPQELAFYRKHHIPLPHKHPNQRHKERLELRK